MLEIKKKIVFTYMEFAEKCKFDRCVDCMYADAPFPKCEALLFADLLVSSGLFASSDADHNVAEQLIKNMEDMQ